MLRQDGDAWAAQHSLAGLCMASALQVPHLFSAVGTMLWGTHHGGATPVAKHARNRIHANNSKRKWKAKGWHSKEWQIVTKTCSAKVRAEHFSLAAICREGRQPPLLRPELLQTV